MLEAFLWALAAALVFAAVGWLVRQPARRRNRKLADAAMHGLIVGQRGYTLRLLSESGDEIGVQEHSRFNPGFYKRPGSTLSYGAISYEVVSVQDDYPRASGTLVLRPAR
jgi:hypothetical protein